MSEENWKLDLGTIEVERAQRDLWKKGVLAPAWAQRFPELFREHDLELAKTQGPDGFAHIEWLATIVLHHTTGYHCAGDYEFHPPNVADLLIKRTPGLRALIDDRTEHGACQGPDLLMYAPDLTDWFFCEVKGTGGPSKRRAVHEVCGYRGIDRKARPPPELQVGTAPTMSFWLGVIDLVLEAVGLSE